MKLVSESISDFLNENAQFKRGLSSEEIRNNLFGFREGQIVLYKNPNIVDTLLCITEYYNEDNIILSGIGYLIRSKDNIKNTKFAKLSGIYNSRLKSENIRILDSGEKKVVADIFNDPKYKSYVDDKIRIISNYSNKKIKFTF